MVEKKQITMFVLNVLGGILIPQLLLPGYFSGIDETSPRFEQLHIWMYLGILVCLGGSILFTLMFYKKFGIAKLLVSSIQAFVASTFMLCLISYITIYIYKPEVSTWSVSDTLIRMFQYPTYVAVYIWQPFTIWIVSVLIFNAVYVVKV